MESDACAELRQYVSDETLASLPRVSFPANVTFIKSDAEDKISNYFILEGTVSVHALANTGREFWIDSLGPGDFIGKFSQMRGNNFNCEVHTDEPCKMIVLTDVLDELLEDKDFNIYFGRRITDRLYAMYKRLMLRLLFSYDEVLAYYLLKAVEGRDAGFAPRIEPLRRVMNVSERQFYYLLKNMEHDGLIRRVGRGRIKLTNCAGLKRAAHDVSDFMNN